MRSRYGEKLNDDSFLIIKQFDIRCLAKPRTVGVALLQWIIYDLCERCGIDKKNVSVAHGFRKFFTTQLVNSKVNPEIREMLLGHKIGLASAYYRPTEKEMYSEYQKAVNNLTINEENRLKLKVQLLEGESNEIQNLKRQINENTDILNKFMKYFEVKPYQGTGPMSLGNDEFRQHIQSEERERKHIARDLQKKGIDAERYF
jgi:integrase/recombinase XerD